MIRSVKRRRKASADRFRVYWVYNPRSRHAYVGKGPDGRIEGEHSEAYEELVRRRGTIQCESFPFSTEDDALIAEATVIGIIDQLPGVKLLNRQRVHSQRFGSRYPFEVNDRTVTPSALARAIVVTIKPDKIDMRIAPNSRWSPEDFAERVRMWWPFSLERVRKWHSGVDAPRFLVAVLKTSAIIAAVFEIDNSAWFSDPENTRTRILAVPIKRPSRPNANGMQGARFTGDRRGPLVWYGRSVG